MSATDKGKKETQIYHLRDDVNRYIEQMKKENQKYNATIENIFKKIDKAFDTIEPPSVRSKK